MILIHSSDWLLETPFLLVLCECAYFFSQNGFSIKIIILPTIPTPFLSDVSILSSQKWLSIAHIYFIYMYVSYIHTCIITCIHLHVINIPNMTMDAFGVVFYSFWCTTKKGFPRETFSRCTYNTLAYHQAFMYICIWVYMNTTLQNPLHITQLICKDSNF